MGDEGKLWGYQGTAASNEWIEGLKTGTEAKAGVYRAREVGRCGELELSGYLIPTG